MEEHFIPAIKSRIYHPNSHHSRYTISRGGWSAATSAQADAIRPIDITEVGFHPVVPAPAGGCLVNQILSCRCEPLEMRRLFSGIHLMHSGELEIIGSGGSANTITVGLTPDQQSLAVSIVYPQNRKTTKTINGTYAVASVTSLYITGGSKADYIAVDQTNGPVNVPATIIARGGNDTVYGSNGPNFVLGGAGNDYIVGGNGNDSLFGQNGRDTLIGGAGDDQLHGDGGDDSLEGDAGNDTLFDAQGPDTMMGGSGNNVFRVRGLTGDKVNDYNAATDKLIIVKFPSDGNSFWDDVLNYYVY
jgi:Ca2+-binding RTX toxin-like protein